ncbi:regulatory protein RecX [Geobacter sp. OR-1]|uniref:regulatory protein RecX n=1 Tax=Geobacter sp. OR-1 TaxID=1266765 RepID=UPI000543A432|nr:regulatory protein RecX [Geobacter sp. OR-1]GAM08697.1 regulatory protein RecX [Geobacter sp. OR-1]
MTDEAKARESAIRILARRDHSKAEMKRKLIRNGFSPEVAEATISSLQEKGYLDDRRYAERWAAAALEGGRCYGPRLRAELRQRGIDQATASEVISELTSGSDETETLRMLLRRRFPEFDPFTADDREKRRIFGFLQRRGFSTGAIMTVFKTVSTEFE